MVGRNLCAVPNGAHITGDDRGGWRLHRPSGAEVELVTVGSRPTIKDNHQLGGLLSEYRSEPAPPSALTVAGPETPIKSSNWLAVKWALPDVLTKKLTGRGELLASTASSPPNDETLSCVPAPSPLNVTLSGVLEARVTVVAVVVPTMVSESAEEEPSIAANESEASAFRTVAAPAVPTKSCTSQSLRRRRPSIPGSPGGSRSRRRREWSRGGLGR
jgi:hypothetical protein